MPGRNVPRKQVFQDRNLQSLIAGHLSETIHFLSNQSISVYLHRNRRQQRGCLLTDCDLPRKASAAACGEQADPTRLATSLFCWKKPISRGKADSPCTWCKGRRTGPPCVLDIWYGVGMCYLLTENGRRREGGREGGGVCRRKQGEKEGDSGGAAERERNMYSDSEDSKKWNTCLCWNIYSGTNKQYKWLIRSFFSWTKTPRYSQLLHDQKSCWCLNLHEHEDNVIYLKVMNIISQQEKYVKAIPKITTVWNFFPPVLVTVGETLKCQTRKYNKVTSPFYEGFQTWESPA